jgi:hypothetical protein
VRTKHEEQGYERRWLLPPPPTCTLCREFLPQESNEPILCLPGVGSFHRYCKPTWRHRLLCRIHALLMPKPRVVSTEQTWTSTGTVSFL